MSCQHRSIDAQYIAYMAQNMSYYMNSCITLEYTDHEVLEVVKYTAEALQKTTLDATRACIMSKNVESSIALPSSGPQLTSQSSGGSPLGHTNLPQDLQYSGISATNRSTGKA
jgi:hypothetical protein